MSVLVKGMEMPMNCDECNMYVGTAYAPGCLIESNGIPNRYNYDPKERPDWCPLVEVKTPHGRLFDETEVKKCLHELPDSEDEWNTIALLEWAIEKRWCIDAEDL